MKLNSSFRKFLLKPKVIFAWSFINVLILFYVQTDSMLFSINSKMRIIEFIILAIVFLLNFVRCVLLKIKIFDFKNAYFEKSLLIALLFIISFLFNLGNTFNIHRYLIQFSNLCLSFLFILSLDLEAFKKSYLYISTIFALVSVIFFVPYYFNEDIFSFFPIIKNSENYQYYFTGFSSLLIRTSSGLIKRNYGIFREPGIYGVFLVFSLILLLFSKNDFKKGKVTCFYLSLIFIFAILTTLSTTTILAMIVLLFCKLFEHKSKTFLQTLKYLLLAGVIVFGFAALFFPESFKNIPFLYSVFGKFNLSNESFASRYFDSLATFATFLKNPIFGVGFGGLHTNITNLATAFNAPSNGGINSILQSFAVHGFVLGLLFTYFICRFMKECVGRKKKIVFICSLFSFFICIFNEDLCNSFFFFAIIFIGIKRTTFVNYLKKKDAYYYVSI